ncbi:hypothetical protein TWF696_002052 [Orbilia brochopaga]|uniref:Uncharacterized protein n=1 Tax=Orbilia brochopaga TaxID=3140254 RepID=A0AAV9U6J5_9PEZI
MKVSVFASVAIFSAVALAAPTGSKVSTEAISIGGTGGDGAISIGGGGAGTTPGGTGTISVGTGGTGTNTGGSGTVVVGGNTGNGQGTGSINLGTGGAGGILDILNGGGAGGGVSSLASSIFNTGHSSLDLGNIFSQLGVGSIGTSGGGATGSIGGGTGGNTGIGGVIGGGSTGGGGTGIGGSLGGITGGGAGGGIGNLLTGGAASIVGGSHEQFNLFRDAFDILSEKLCDFALNEAVRFAEFWVFVPAQSIEELFTAWADIAANGFADVSTGEIEATKKKAALAKETFDFVREGTIQGVRPGEFMTATTYLRCRQLAETNPNDFVFDPTVGTTDRASKGKKTA